MIDFPLATILLLVTVLLVVGAASSLCGAVLLREARLSHPARHWTETRRYGRQGAIAIAAGLPAFAIGLALLVLLGRIVVPG